jgi:hypothetical protein
MSVALADTAVLTYERLLDTPGINGQQRAGYLHQLSSWLSRTGRSEDALAAIDEAVTAYHGLARARPDAFLPDLAGSLNNQSSHLSALGRREDAPAAIDEAVTAVGEPGSASVHGRACHQRPAATQILHPERVVVPGEQQVGLGRATPCCSPAYYADLLAACSGGSAASGGSPGPPGSPRGRVKSRVVPSPGGLCSLR